MATYSERIRELRKMRGMSQQDLADKLDLNKVAVSQYERGVRRPNIDIVSALCDIFNVSSDYLLGEDDMTIRIVNADEIKKLDSPRRIPVLGRVAAGIPIDAIEDILDWEEILTTAIVLHGFETFWLHFGCMAQKKRGSRSPLKYPKNVRMRLRSSLTSSAHRTVSPTPRRS